MDTRKAVFWILYSLFWLPKGILEPALLEILALSWGGFVLKKHSLERVYIHTVAWKGHPFLLTAISNLGHFQLGLHCWHVYAIEISSMCV